MIAVLTCHREAYNQHIIILPLSHKSRVLCLYEPLPVSGALGDDFFEIFDVENLFFFF